MKKLFLLLLLSAWMAAPAQTSSVFHVETEYTVQFGYRYFYDKLDPQTGVSTRLSQLPVYGYFTGFGFFNCYNHYVFQGIDTVLPNGNYVNRLYELDTLGNLIRSIPMDTAVGTWYVSCLPSASSPYYYALRRNTSNQLLVLEKIDALSGSRTITPLPAISSYGIFGSDVTITAADDIWMGMNDQTNGHTKLIRINTQNGQTAELDSITTGSNYFYNCLVYDCPGDTIYGFVTHADSVYGAELLKIHASSATVIHTGRHAIGSGFFNAGAYTLLSDGRFYARGSAQTYLLNDFNVPAPVFPMTTTATPSTLSTFCYGAPRQVCANYTPCEETSGAAEWTSTGGLRVFPNPVENGMLEVTMPGKFQVRLTDLAGRVVFSGQATDKMQIAVDHLAAGVYGLQAGSAEQTAAAKIIVAH